MPHWHLKIFYFHSGGKSFCGDKLGRLSIKKLRGWRNISLAPSEMMKWETGVIHHFYLTGSSYTINATTVFAVGRNRTSGHARF